MNALQCRKYSECVGSQQRRAIRCKACALSNRLARGLSVHAQGVRLRVYDFFLYAHSIHEWRSSTWKPEAVTAALAEQIKANPMPTPCGPYAVTAACRSDQGDQKATKRRWLERVYQAVTVTAALRSDQGGGWNVRIGGHVSTELPHTNQVLLCTVHLHAVRLVHCGEGVCAQLCTQCRTREDKEQTGCCAADCAVAERCPHGIPSDQHHDRLAEAAQRLDGLRGTRHADELAVHEPEHTVPHVLTFSCSCGVIMKRDTQRKCLVNVWSTPCNV